MLLSVTKVDETKESLHNFENKKTKNGFWFKIIQLILTADSKFSTMKFFLIYITVAIKTSICALIAFLKICSYYELSHDSLIGKTASFKGNNVSQECKFLIDFLESK